MVYHIMEHCKLGKGEFKEGHIDGHQKCHCLDSEVDRMNKWMLQSTSWRSLLGYQTWVLTRLF